MTQRKYRTLEKYIDDYLEEEPERIDGFLQTALEEYEKDRNEKALLMALRQVAKAKGGISVLAERTNLSRESLYKTLSPNGNPRLKTLQSILESFGFVLTFKPLKTA